MADSAGTERIVSTAGAELRPARPADLAAVERILVASDLPTVGVEQALADFVVAEKGGSVVAVAGREVHGADGILRSVAVIPELRGRGLGARLIHRVVRAARKAGHRRLYLLTTTAADYFRRHGFRRIEREEASPEVRGSVEFRQACPDSAVAMVLELR